MLYGFFTIYAALASVFKLASFYHPYPGLDDIPQVTRFLMPLFDLISLLPAIALIYVFSSDYEKVLPSGEKLISVTGPGNIPSGRIYLYAIILELLMSAGGIFLFMGAAVLLTGAKAAVIGFLSIPLLGIIVIPLFQLFATVSGFLLGAAIRRQTPGDEGPAATPPAAPPSVHPAGGFGKRA